VKAVILAGGYGSRLGEETTVRPKPMVEIGGKPILWHIMKLYSFHGIREFIICCGYLGYVIKEYFANYFLHNSDVTFDLANNRMVTHETTSEPWKVTLVDTGAETATGGRMKLVRDHIDGDAFCFTYGDAVADVDVSATLAFHREHGKLATMTTVQPPSKYGVLAFDGKRITNFEEKPKGEGGWINGGFFVLSPKVIDYIDGLDMPWEYDPIQRLVAEGQLAAYFHRGYWQCMDTLRDKNVLEAHWGSGRPPWRVWE
jgi:glucose-1-phosphate cytidylyltransferase